MKPIFIFYHIFQYGEWKRIVREQLSRIKASGLYDASTAIFVRVIGDDEANYRNLIAPYKKIHTTNFDTSNDHETTSLWNVWKFAQEIIPFRGTAGLDAAFLYLHTKGVFSGREETGVGLHMEDWRNYMEHFNIDQWEKCINALQAHSVVGVNYRIQNLFGKVTGHFSGNFWWANASYIYRLPEIKPGWDWAEYEFWIGTGNPLVLCLHESGVDHYCSRYEEGEYK